MNQNLVKIADEMACEAPDGVKERFPVDGALQMIMIWPDVKEAFLKAQAACKIPIEFRKSSMNVSEMVDYLNNSFKQLDVCQDAPAKPSSKQFSEYVNTTELNELLGRGGAAAFLREEFAWVMNREKVPTIVKNHTSAWPTTAAITASRKWTKSTVSNMLAFEGTKHNLVVVKKAEVKQEVLNLTIKPAKPISIRTQVEAHIQELTPNTEFELPVSIVTDLGGVSALKNIGRDNQVTLLITQEDASVGHYRVVRFA